MTQPLEIGSPSLSEDHLHNVISTWENIISEHEDKDSPFEKGIVSSARLENEATDILQPSNLESNIDLNANIVPEETQTETQLDLERKNQLERRIKKKTREKKKKRVVEQQSKSKFPYCFDKLNYLCKFV